jgi:hypothetical protein
VLRQFVLVVLSDMKNNIYEAEIPPPRFSYYIKIKNELQDILCQVAYSRQGKQHVTLLGVTKKLKDTV